MNVRTVAASALLALGAVAGIAGSAAADPAYPPTTPTPESSVLPTSVTQAPAASTTEPATAVLGTRIAALPRTGGEILTWSLVGGALVAGGAGAVVATRRRSTRQH